MASSLFPARVPPRSEPRRGFFCRGRGVPGLVDFRAKAVIRQEVGSPRGVDARGLRPLGRLLAGLARPLLKPLLRVLAERWRGAWRERPLAVEGDRRAHHLRIAAGQLLHQLRGGHSGRSVSCRVSSAGIRAPREGRAELAQLALVRYPSSLALARVGAPGTA